jgi:hypothetical protein
MEHTVMELGPVNPIIQALLGDKVNNPIKLWQLVPDPVPEAS